MLVSIQSTISRKIHSENYNLHNLYQFSYYKAKLAEVAPSVIFFFLDHLNKNYYHIAQSWIQTEGKQNYMQVSLPWTQQLT